MHIMYACLGKLHSLVNPVHPDRQMELIADKVLLVDGAVPLIGRRFEIMPADLELLFPGELAYGNAVHHEHVFPLVEYSGQAAVDLFCPGGQPFAPPVIVRDVYQVGKSSR